MSDSPNALAGPSKHRRNYKACLACRQRRLRCDQGDPDNPDDGPCSRCRREGRVCEFAETDKTGKKKRRVSAQQALPKRHGAGGGTVIDPDLAHLEGLDLASFPGMSLNTATSSNPHLDFGFSNYQPEEPTPGSKDERDLLTSSSLHNPGDALHILAAASTLNNSDAPPINVPGEWDKWPPVAKGLIRPTAALKLLLLYKAGQASLYNLVPMQVLDSNYLPYLLSTESLLLGAMISIAALYIAHDPDLHTRLQKWIREEIGNIIDGYPGTRHISNVEALLLLAEWPPLAPKTAGGDKLGAHLANIKQTDALSWTYIGLAVRLAQELGLEWKGLNNVDMLAAGNEIEWTQERDLRTWLHCYDADRQVSVRLGRSSVIQPYLSSQWWEKISSLATKTSKPNSEYFLGYTVGRHRGLLAALIATVHDRFYSEGDITQTLLRTGRWENLLRSMSIEISRFHQDLSPLLDASTPEAILLEMELDYVRLYGNGIALRALQERLYRIQRDHTAGYINRPLFNLAEGPYIFSATEAAQNILKIVKDKLDPKVLTACPLRTFHRVLFAATFILKALVVGVVEHSHEAIFNTLHGAITALETARFGSDHVATGVAALLRRMLSLHNSLQPNSSSSGSKSVLRGDSFSQTLAHHITDPPASNDFVNLWPPTEQSLEVDRQQDLAFQNLWGGSEITGDDIITNLFSWFGDGAAQTTTTA